MHPDRDPYAPPPTHKDKSGAIVRIFIVAALIGAAAWGYMQYSQAPQTAGLTAPPIEEQMADSSMDQGYQAVPTPEAAPQATPSPAPGTSQPTDPLPPPTTTTEQPPA